VTLGNSRSIETMLVPWAGRSHHAAWQNASVALVVIAFWILRNTPGPVGHWLHS